MKIRKSFIVAVAVMGSLAGTAALAAYTQVVRHRGPGGPDGMVGRLVDDKAVQERLGLSADQVARLKSIRDDARTSIRKLRGQAMKSRADLRAMMLDTKATRQDLEQRAAAVRDSVSAVSQEITHRLLDARDVLSVDQREELRSIIRERVGGPRQRMQRWRRHGPTQDGAPSTGADDGAATDDAAPDPSDTQ